MADLRDTKRKVTTALLVLLVLDVAAAAVLLSPIGRRQTTAEVAQLQRDLQVKTREVAPLQDIDKKVEQAKQQVNDFFANRLPTRYSQIADELGKIAQENHVQFANVQYSTQETDLPDTRQVLMDASLAGDYVQVMKFINALERSKTLFLVDGITLGEEQRATGAVRLTIRIETYMKSGSEAPGSGAAASGAPTA